MFVGMFPRGAGGPEAKQKGAISSKGASFFPGKNEQVVVGISQSEKRFFARECRA